MAGNEVNFEIDRGITFSRTITWKDSTGTVINLTGYTAVMKIREKYSNVSTLLHTVSTTIPSPTSGQIVLTISATDTASFNWSEGYYDLVLVSSGGEKTKLIKGKFLVGNSVSV